MTTIKLIVTGASARAEVDGLLTSGMVGIPVTIVCDGAWDGLTKSMVCRAGGIARTILNVENSATVAHECMVPNQTLYIGIEGRNADGTLVIPTVWALCGIIFSGATTGADPSADPALPVWAQIQRAVGNLDDLNTEAKDNLVAAINEAMEKGGGEVDPEAVQQIVETYLAENPPAPGDTGPQGPQGEKGDTGATGPAGANGVPGTDGKDGITPTIGENGNWYLGDTDTGKPSRGEPGQDGSPGAAGSDGYTPVKGTDYFTDADKQEIAEAAAGMVSIPEKLPNPNALTFTGAISGSYDGSSPLEINIPIGGSSGGSGKAKTQKLIDITFSEPTASLSVTLEHNFHKLFLVWSCGSGGVARTVDADGNAVSGTLGICLDATSYGWNARKILQINGNKLTWQTTAGFIQYTDDLSTLLQSSVRNITTCTNGDTNNSFGGTSAMIGTLGGDALAPTAGRTVNIVTSSGFFATTTRIILVGEYYE